MKSPMGFGKAPSTHKRAMKTQAGEGGPIGGARSAAEVPGRMEANGMKAPGGMGMKSVPTSKSPARNMQGVDGGSVKAPSKGLTSQGNKSGGPAAGHSRTNSGKNRIGSGRQQTRRF